MSSTNPVFVVVRSEAVFRVRDAPRVVEAARMVIAGRDYGDGPAAAGKRAADLTAAASDVTAAVLELVDPRIGGARRSWGGGAVERGRRGGL